MIHRPNQENLFIFQTLKTAKGYAGLSKEIFAINLNNSLIYLDGREF